jgi:hypothetical protein
VVDSVGPQTATTTNWPTGTETESGVLKLPLPSATVLPTGVEPIDNWTGLSAAHPVPDAVTGPPGGIEWWSSCSTWVGGVAGGVVVGGTVVVGVVVDVVVVGAVVVVAAGTVVTWGTVGGTVTRGRVVTVVGTVVTVVEVVDVVDVVAVVEVVVGAWALVVGVLQMTLAASRRTCGMKLVVVRGTVVVVLPKTHTVVVVGHLVATPVASPSI